jgi:hypothetical protein
VERCVRVFAHQCVRCAELLRVNDATAAPESVRCDGGRTGAQGQGFLFLYYDGQRDSKGRTQAAIVPTAAERNDDFSGLTNAQTGQPAPLINLFFGAAVSGKSDSSIDDQSDCAQAEQFYPLSNIGTNVFKSTLIGTDNYDQGGARLDHLFNGGKEQLFARYPGREGTISVRCRLRVRASRNSR